jgi:hypothetical protein
MTSFSLFAVIDYCISRLSSVTYNGYFQIPRHCSCCYLLPVNVTRSNSAVGGLRLLPFCLLLSICFAGSARPAETPPVFKWVTPGRALTQTTLPADCAVDDLGNSYVTGQAGSTSTFVFGTNAADGGDIFVAKCDPHGNVLWLLRDGPSAGCLGWRIGLDASRNVFVFGQFGSFPPTVPFAGTNISCALAIGKYNSDGVPLGATPIAQRVANNSNPYAIGMAVHPSNGLFCTLLFHGPMIFGSTNLIGRTDSSPYDDYALLKLSAAGEVEWVRQIKGSGAPFVMSRPALDDEGNVFVAGSFVEMVSFGGTNLTASSGYVSFLAKYSPQGDLLRVTGIGRGPFLRAWNVALDHDANCYVSMFFQEQALPLALPPSPIALALTTMPL